MFSPVVPKGTFGKNFGTSFSIEWPLENQY